MGIGNNSVFGHTVARVASLPLMGIGNNSSRGLTVISLGSLPLMGIGNPGTAPAALNHFFSHYPSWGSETLGFLSLYLHEWP